ncbi:Nucleotide-binding universal stress protein, UspA family [Streptoalloteichus tenebrarius]|uniref:Nucleotide-binding universal stress protein, UspA family n=1 Tax=Streptoalloteichus tenebrarius (strain ATCC 17920 / DSM 40477 / JCM 4838 / CBS 697.72 / NBRC 16177 / NCIMB 11028 / NRRL B-12390 / A12253. 1 / ISP 5477) TaxID=1933 RepID=A0ABT1I0C2_STRSD|nr:universal stress protein [Streptoalloteichus tenebrarius]MCP2261231.1 Nucleotide-binding universal stress protein, UspA family [Streptoalloteichus tenebrarius]BFF04423.1 universal stress protein [Streptoalloteichus tenebrarius]
MTTRERIVVVGVDGSPRGVAALRWALEYAEEVGARVRAVSVCPVSPVLPSSVPLPVSDLAGADALMDQHRALVAEAVNEARTPSTRVAVDQVVAYGESGPVLCAAAEDATLLVVGSHGHGRMMAALLGSTSGYCVHHAPCPVVVVTPTAAGRLRPPDTANTDRRE